MKLPDVNSRYGAPMGRRGKGLTGAVGPVRFHLQKIPLDSGGYDSGGAQSSVWAPNARYHRNGRAVMKLHTILALAEAPVTALVTGAFVLLAAYSRQEAAYTLEQVQAVNTLAGGCADDWLCEMEPLLRK